MCYVEPIGDVEALEEDYMKRWQLITLLGAAAIVIGLIMMIVGLGLGVTMIMLPVGIPVGLLGVAMVVAGVFARFDEPRR